VPTILNFPEWEFYSNWDAGDRKITAFFTGKLYAKTLADTGFSEYFVVGFHNP
jgi:hypothetical protein